MKHLIIGVLAATLLAACNEKPNPGAENAAHPTQPAMHADGPTGTGVQKGTIVPAHEVCMVNDAYMGKKQLEVQVGGKTYYGCCEMCKERLPKDASVRTATDPYSQKPVDKASAVIAVTGNGGEVSYFENETTYNNYIKQL